MIIGLDLSLRAAAACWIPRGWKGDTTKLKVGTWGEELTKGASLEDKIKRMIYIADSIVTWAEERTGVKAMFVEDYAFQIRSASAAPLHELGGIVKRECYVRLGLALTPVNISSGRKTLLQKLPGKGAKEFTERNVRRLKGEALYWNNDEVDAFVVANHGVMLSGGTPLSFEGQIDA